MPQEADVPKVDPGHPKVVQRIRQCPENQRSDGLLGPTKNAKEHCIIIFPEIQVQRFFHA